MIQGDVPNVCTNHVTCIIQDTMYVFGGKDDTDQKLYRRALDLTSGVWCQPPVTGEGPFGVLSAFCCIYRFTWFIYQCLWLQDKIRRIFLPKNINYSFQFQEIKHYLLFEDLNKSWWMAEKVIKNFQGFTIEKCTYLVVVKVLNITTQTCSIDLTRKHRSSATCLHLAYVVRERYCDVVVGSCVYVFGG